MPTNQFNGFLKKVEWGVYYKYALFLYTTLYCFVTGNIHYLHNFKFPWLITKQICKGLNGSCTQTTQNKPRNVEGHSFW